jgi:transcriptional regulator with XRE-family HTH domain
MAFGDRLKELRTAANLSREELAEKSGLSRGGVRDLEQGVRSPSWKTVQLLAKALNVDCTAFQDAPAPEKKTSRKPKKN